jgi:CheY-like chemotaxis protein
MPDHSHNAIPPPPALHVIGTARRVLGADAPLRMPTLMLVEDSRYASEVVRLYARSLGLRLRRAADLDAAQSHLRLYQPDIVLIDLGLPDGRGEALIEQLARASQRPPLLIAISGQPELRAGALAAGADVFIEKPMPDIATFRALLVDHFPGPLPLLLLPSRAPSPIPDRIALQDDLSLAAQSLTHAETGTDRPLTRARMRYVAGLINGIAGSLGDGPLQAAAQRQMSNVEFGASNPSFRKLRDLVNERLRDIKSEKGL